MKFPIENFFKKQINIFTSEEDPLFFEKIFNFIFENKNFRQRAKIIYLSKNFSKEKILGELKKGEKSIFVFNSPFPIERKFFFEISEFKFKVKICFNADFLNKRIFEGLPLETLSFGKEKNSNFCISFLNFDHGMNFKLEFFGKTLPVFIGNLFGKKVLYSSVANLVLAYFFGFNLIEIAEKLKNLPSFPGRMRLIEGIEGSFIFDNSDCKTEEEFLEAIEIFLKLQSFKRKLLVAGKNKEIFFLPSTAIFQLQSKFLMKKMEVLFDPKIVKKIDDPKLLIEKIKISLSKNDLLLLDGFNSEMIQNLVDEFRKIW